MRRLVLLASATNASLQQKVHQPKQDKEVTTEKTEFNIKLLPKSLVYAKLFILAKDPLEVGENILYIHITIWNLSYLHYLRLYETFCTCYLWDYKGKNIYESFWVTQRKICN